jgi:Tfp pilus assembly protein PilF
VAQQIRKVSASSFRRPIEKVPSLGQQFMLTLQQHRLLAGGGILGLICIVVVGVVIVAYWGERQRRGVQELRLGISALQTGELDKAAVQLASAEQHLQKESDDYLIQLVQLNLGYVAEQQGDLSRARHYYETSADMDGPVKSEAILSTAHVLTLMKEDAAAVSSYKQFLEQYQDSPLAEIVRQKVGDK